MAERLVTIVNKNGLHARPAAEIVKTAAKFASDVVIVRDDLEVNGKSIMGVLMLAAECGSTITLRASGVPCCHSMQRTHPRCSPGRSPRSTGRDA
jgi:phosphocarrier protein